MTCMYISRIALNFDSGPRFILVHVTELKSKYTGGLLKKTACIGYITTKNVCLSTDVSAVSILNILLSMVVLLYLCSLPGFIFP